MTALMENATTRQSPAILMRFMSLPLTLARLVRANAGWQGTLLPCCGLGRALPRPHPPAELTTLGRLGSSLKASTQRPSSRGLGRRDQRYANIRSLIGTVPHRPINELEKALARGQLDMAAAIAKDFAREHGRPIPLGLAPASCRLSRPTELPTMPGPADG
jgi:hypothetical protein